MYLFVYACMYESVCRCVFVDLSGRDLLVCMPECMAVWEGVCTGVCELVCMCLSECLSVRMWQ